MFNTALGYSNRLINASHTLYIFLAIFLKFFSMIQFYVFRLLRLCIAYDYRPCSCVAVEAIGQNWALSSIAVHCSV